MHEAEPTAGQAKAQQAISKYADQADFILEAAAAHLCKLSSLLVDLFITQLLWYAAVCILWVGVELTVPAWAKTPQHEACTKLSTAPRWGVHEQSKPPHTHHLTSSSTVLAYSSVMRRHFWQRSHCTQLVQCAGSTADCCMLWATT
jgi:hypothetical protein